MSGVLAVGEIRAAFPALQRVEGRHPVAYFDGPGGTQVPEPVIEAMAGYLRGHNANTHWAYPTSAETDAIILAAREAFAEFLNGRPEEVVFGQNMTTLAFHLARGLGREWVPGDEVVVTDLDHHANRAPWTDLVRERGITIRSVPFDPATGELDLGALERLVGTRTRLVAVTAASNAIGTCPDVARVVSLARAAGALSFVDGVHAAAHQLPDVQALDCDFYACSPYKFYGPHLGVLWGREELLARVAVPRLDPAPDTSPERLETGTLSHEAIAGAAAGVRFLAGLDQDASGTLRERLARVYQALHARSATLFDRLWSGLESLPVRRYGPGPARGRAATLGFTIPGRNAEQVVRQLAGQGLFLSHGDFYAATVIERLGLGSDGLLRAGCACYTTEAEVDRLVAGIAGLSGTGSMGSQGRTITASSQ